MKRRKFLKSVGTGVGGYFLAGAIKQMLFSDVMGLISHARAEAIGAQIQKNYLYIHTGSLSRFLFDAWITPDGNRSDALIFGNMYNAFRSSNGSVYDRLDYKTFEYKGVHVPHQFSHQVPTSQGLVGMNNLLDHMATIRGIYSGIDGHGFNAELQVRPDISMPSLGGIASEIGESLLGALTANGTQVGSFKSRKGNQLTSISTNGNVISNLLAGYQMPNRSISSIEKREDITPLVDAAAQLMKKASNSPLLPGSSSLLSNTINAKKLMTLNINELMKAWDPLFEKYKRIISAAIRISVANLDGISSKSILPGSFKPTDQSENFNIIINTNQSAGSANSPLPQGFDLRQMIDEITHADQLAARFAMSEFVLTGGSALESGLSNVLHFNAQGELAQVKTGSGARISNGSDEHGVSAPVSIYLNTAFYRGLTAGLLELISVLKAKNVFNDTLIHVAGDFGRSPRNNFTGSDHGFNGTSIALISGTIDGPMVAGNIRREAKNGGRTGTWEGGIVDYGSGRERTKYRNVAAVIADFLVGREKNPWNFVDKPFSLINGKLRNNIGAKIVED